MFKKVSTILCLALVLILALSSFAVAEEKVTIRIAAWGSQLRTEYTQAALDYYSSLHPNVAFEYEAYDYSSYASVIATRAAVGDLPDMMQGGSFVASQWVPAGMLMDLKPFMESGELDVTNVPQTILDQNLYTDGGIYAISIGSNCPGILYNMDAVKEAGLELTNETTWDEFVEICKAMYEKTGMKADVEYSRNDQLLWSRVRDYGYQLYDNGTLGVPDEKIFTEIFAFYKAGVEEGWHISPEVYVELTPGAVETDPILNGTTWCTFANSNQIAAFSKACNGAFEMGMIPFPANNPTQSRWLKQSQSMTISSSCEHPEIAIDVLNDWTNSLEFNTFLMAERGVPVSSVIASGMTAVLDENASKALELVNYVAANSSPINLVYPEGTVPFTTLYLELVDEVMYGELSPEEAGKMLYTDGLKCFK